MWRAAFAHVLLGTKPDVTPSIREEKFWSALPAQALRPISPAAVKARPLQELGSLLAFLAICILHFETVDHEQVKEYRA